VSIKIKPLKKSYYIRIKSTTTGILGIFPQLNLKSTKRFVTFTHKALVMEIR